MKVTYKINDDGTIESDSRIDPNDEIFKNLAGRLKPTPLYEKVKKDADEAGRHNINILKKFFIATVFTTVAFTYLIGNDISFESKVLLIAAAPFVGMGLGFGAGYPLASKGGKANGKLLIQENKEVLRAILIEFADSINKINAAGAGKCSKGGLIDFDIDYLGFVKSGVLNNFKITGYYGDKDKPTELTLDLHFSLDYKNLTIKNYSISW